MLVFIIKIQDVNGEAPSIPFLKKKNLDKYS